MLHRSIASEDHTVNIEQDADRYNPRGTPNPSILLRIKIKLSKPCMVISVTDPFQAGTEVTQLVQ
jgi:hypothetical protein